MALRKDDTQIREVFQFFFFILMTTLDLFRVKLLIFALFFNDTIYGDNSCV